MYKYNRKLQINSTIETISQQKKQDYIENKLNVRILAVVNLIIDVLEKMVKSIDIELITKNVITNIEDFGLIVNSYTFNYQKVE